eukprot:6099267-Prymnesium_polylepis.1
MACIRRVFARTYGAECVRGRRKHLCIFRERIRGSLGSRSPPARAGHGGERQNLERPGALTSAPGKRVDTSAIKLERRAGVIVVALRRTPDPYRSLTGTRPRASSVSPSSRGSAAPPSASVSGMRSQVCMDRVRPVSSHASRAAVR